MRMWVQLRSPAGGGQRWGRSFYLDGEPRDVLLPFSTFLPMGDADRSAVALGEVSSLLLVVDTTYAAPGASGRFVLQSLAAGR